MLVQQQNGVDGRHRCLLQTVDKIRWFRTVQAILKVMSDVLQSLDTVKLLVLVLLDLSAAFDSVDHDTL